MHVNPNLETNQVRIMFTFKKVASYNDSKHLAFNFTDIDVDEWGSDSHNYSSSEHKVRVDTNGSYIDLICECV